MCARLRRRTIAASVLPMIIAAAVAVSGWAWPGWMRGSGGSAFGIAVLVLAVAFCAVVVRRAQAWARASIEADRWSELWSAHVPQQGPEPWSTDTSAGWSAGEGAVAADAWVAGVCAEPAPIFKPRSSIPLIRRTRQYSPFVLPLRATSGPMAAGHAVVVHGRPDRAQPAADDRIVVRALAARGPILIGRLDDGVVFASDRWIAGIG